ncbi:dihydrofolate reductase-like domain-containing protein, partial [Naematelia encephala]
PPQPLILDPQLRFPIEARILSEWNDNKDDPNQIVRQPWIICGDTVDRERVDKVEEAGAKVVPVQLDSHGRISPNSLPSILTSLNLKSVMVEGGSRILSSFLHAPPREDGSPLVDSVIVTVAPMFIGDGDENTNLPILKTVHTEVMGRDAVMVCEVHISP